MVLLGNCSIAGLFMAVVAPGSTSASVCYHCYFFGLSGMRKLRAPPEGGPGSLWLATPRPR